jgi:hypothetical protein
MQKDSDCVSLKTMQTLYISLLSIGYDKIKLLKQQQTWSTVNAKRQLFLCLSSNNIEFKMIISDVIKNVPKLTVESLCETLNLTEFE